MDLETAQTTTTAKLPILKQENGNSFKPAAQTTTTADGTSTTLIPGPVTTEEKDQKKNDMKSRSMLLLALPNEHLMTFIQYKDAKTLFAAIQTRFGGFRRFSTNEVNTAYGVSTANTQVSPASTQVSTASTRKTGRKITINGSDTAGYDKSKVECFNCHKMGHFAREYKGPRNQDSRNRNQDSSRRTVNVEETSSKAMVAIDGAGFDWSYMADDEVRTNMTLMAFSESELKSELEKLKQEKESNQLKIENFDNASKSLDKLIESQIIDKSRKGVGFVSYNDVPPPHTGLFSPPDLDLSYSTLEEFQQPQFEGYRPKTSKSVSEDISNEADCNYHQRERVVSGNNYTRVNYNYSPRKAHPSAHKNIVPRAVLMKTGLRPLNTVRPINTAHPKTIVYSARPMLHFSKSAQSTVKRPYQIRTTLTNKVFSQKDNAAKGKFYTARPKAVNTVRPNSAVVNVVRANQVNAVKASACWVWRPTKLNSASITLKRHNYGHPQKEDQGNVDSGCSRHMTWNMSYLSNFKESDGGYVTFGGGAKGGKITGKGTLKTDTGCFVLSHDFKLADKSQVLLKVPRKNNMYSVDMKNIVPKESLTCLVAKATLDESMLWHRRLGKQHKASCKSKIQNSITQPLLKLHMDLFGPTFVSILMNKKYCIVVTDDYSRFTWVFFLATKDETSGILKSFITEVENLVNNKVKIIRCDNGTEFKNRVMSDFCEKKGIKKEFSAKAVNIACYVQNRVLVVKPHNKTPYELFRGKFDGKSDEEFFIGYSLNSTKSNDFGGTEESIGAGHSRKETGSSQDNILMPLWKDGSLFDSSSKNASNDEPQPSSDAGKKDDEGTQPSESESQSSEFDTCESNISTEPSELVSEPVVNESNVECQPKVWSDAPIIEEYESDSEDEYVSIPTKQQETPSFANQQVKTPRETVKNQFTHSQKPKVDKKELGYGFTVRACFVCGSLNHLIRDCDFHEKRMARKAELNNGWNRKSSQRDIRKTWNNVQRVNKQNQFVPSAVLTRTGKIPVNTARASGTKNVSTARQSFNRQAVLTSTAMKVNTVKPIVNRVRPANVFHKTHSPFSRSFKKTTVLSTKFSKQKVNTAKVNAVSAVGGKRETAVKPSAGCNWRPQRYNWHNDYPHRALKNKGIVDSGCSRHMTGNKAYLAEFQDFNGGPVAFGGSKGYITGKGKIKTGKLDFEDVCFVKELQHFNLFSVSQMCDKKNKVLFTDSECLVLSPEFKLPDENQVLLKIPRQNNMYSFNLENIVPSGGLASLIAKATTDESNKWHRRLGHVNFKNLNKLVKRNLDEGASSERPYEA
ncbi:ribonuclease H-like domain-containing protein [Tanacetum coccineum]